MSIFGNAVPPTQEPQAAAPLVRPLFPQQEPTIVVAAEPPQATPRRRGRPAAAPVAAIPPAALEEQAVAPHVVTAEPAQEQPVALRRGRPRADTSGAQNARLTVIDVLKPHALAGLSFMDGEMIQAILDKNYSKLTYLSDLVNS